jgi:cytochrome c oxidase cbb3-type subunit IV
MDYGTYGSLMTIVMLVVFLCIIAWAWSGKRRAAFDAAARMPLEDDDLCATGTPQDKEIEK